jgi:hypothetical protein
LALLRSIIRSTMSGTSFYSRIGLLIRHYGSSKSYRQISGQARKILGIFLANSMCKFLVKS